MAHITISAELSVEAMMLDSKAAHLDKEERPEILHLSEPLKDEEWLIYAWDGTDTKPNAICSNLEDELKHPLHLQVETLRLSREILCTFPTVGTILRIT